MPFRRTTGPHAGVPGTPFNVKATYTLDDLAAKFHRKFGQGALAEIIKENMRPMYEEAVLLCPVDTGALRASIRLEIVENIGLRAVVVLTAGNPDGSASAREGVFYAPYVEFGTSRRPATPFLRPAWESWNETVKHRIAEDLARILNLGEGQIFKRVR